MRERADGKNEKFDEIGPLSDRSGKLMGDLEGALDPMKKGAQQRCRWRDPLMG